MRVFKFGIAIIMLLQLSSCAVMSKSDCLDANWHRVGFEVAMDGETNKKAAFDKRSTLCSKHGVQADWIAFEAGHEEGMQAYCETKNAVRLGTQAAGKSLRICDNEDNPQFASAYQAGYRLHELRRAELQAQQELERLENAEYRIRRRIRDVRSSVDENSSEEQQRDAQRRARYLRRDASNIRYDQNAWRDRYYQAKEAADAYEEYLELEYGEL